MKVPGPVRYTHIHSLLDSTCGVHCAHLVLPVVILYINSDNFSRLGAFFVNIHQQKFYWAYSNLRHANHAWIRMYICIEWGTILTIEQLQLFWCVLDLRNKYLAGTRGVCCRYPFGYWYFTFPGFSILSFYQRDFIDDAGAGAEVRANTLTVWSTRLWALWTQCGPNLLLRGSRRSPAEYHRHHRHR